MLLTTHLRITGILLCAFAFIPSLSLRADPLLQSPKRSLNSQTVDLTPLFRWWTNQAGERPLRAWVRVNGPVLATNIMGWVLEARVETPAPATESTNAAAKEQTKIILKHPPARELAEFERLAAQLKDLDDQRGRLSAQESSAEKRAESAAARANSGSGLRGEAYFQKEQQYNQTASDAKDQIKDLDKQIKDLHAKLDVYSDSAKYAVDTFALDLHQQYDGLPVFDRGFVFK
jgi:hypothetical protein